MPDDVTSPGTLHLRETEEKMRRALGLSGQVAPQPHRAVPDMHRPKRRFVADGEVPVTVLPSSGRRHEAEEAGRLDAERQAREAAERALHEAQATIRDLQTRLRHAEMALSEVKATTGAERARADQAEASQREAEASLRDTEVSLREAEARLAKQQAMTAKQQVTTVKQAANPETKRQTKPEPVTRRTVVRKAAPKRVDAKPVKWWLNPKAPKKKTAAKKR